MEHRIHSHSARHAPTYHPETGRTRTLQVDVDEMADLAASARVEAMPTFHFMKEDRIIDRFVGADDAKLAAYVKTHQ